MANEFIARKGLIALDNSSVSGSLDVSGSLTIESSGSTLFEVVGSEGQLFSITDSLSGSLFAVSDVSGLPILEVFSNDTVKIGSFNNEAITVSGSHTTIGGVLAIPGFTNVSASLAAAVAGGDDLGNHTATQDLNMGGNAITNVGNVDGVDVSALNTSVSTNTTNIATLTAATSSYSTATGVENNADVTDTANVTAAGALMDSEVTNLAQVKAFDSSDYATAAQGAKADTAIQPADTGSFLTTVDISTDTNLAVGNGITLTGDTLSTNDSQIVHDNLSGFVANEHIDHSTVSITAGNGLTGGGTIASTRTIDVGAGDGISVAANSVAVDGTVLRTTGKNVISSSAQISTDISGAFTAGSGISLSSGEFSVAAGTGLTQGATGLSFDADGGTLTTNNADVDHILINDGGTFKRITKGNINVGDFNNDAGYLTSSPFTAAGISGSFTSVSASLAADIPTNNNQLTNGAGYLTTVDISTDTNLAGGTNLTLSGDTMNLDANISLTNITASGNISASGYIYGTPLVGPNEYAFRYTNGGTIFDTGLFFSQTNGQYEFLNGSATCVFCIKAGSGNTTIYGNLTASSDVDIQGILSIPGFTNVSASLAAAVAGGDNLGNHTATQNLNMGTYAITNVGNVDGVDVSTLKSDFDTLEGKTLVSGSSQIDLGSATGTAANASTASYVAGSNVDGTVALSSLATTAINATNATNIDVNNVSGNTEYGLVFRDGNGDGNQALYADNETDQPSYNPSTNTIKTPIISASSALYVGGNITVTGNVDGVDVSTLKSDFDTLEGKTLISSSAQILPIATSSITDFPTEVSRSAAAAGFGSGGGGGTGDGFPYTGSAGISGSLEIVGSGSNVFNIEGSLGQLFSVSDSFSGSLFKVATISGTPVLEAFSDNTVKIGTFNNEGLIVGGNNVTASGDVDIQGTLSLPGIADVSASLASAGGGGSGNVSNTGTPVNDQIAVWTDATTIEGTTKLTFENSTITVHSTNADNTGIEIYGGVYPTVTSWISPIGASNKMNFGDGSTGHIFDFLNNKIAFDGDSTNTYIQANTDTPEDLEIHADQDIILAADNAVVIGAVTDVEDRISSYRVVLQSNAYLAQSTLVYLPFNSLSEQTNFNYLSITPAAANGRLVSITIWPQSGGGSTVMGLHVNSNATAASTDTQTLSTGVPTTFTFSSGNTFSQNDELSFSIDPTSNPNGISAQIILEYDY